MINQQAVIVEESSVGFWRRVAATVLDVIIATVASALIPFAGSFAVFGIYWWLLASMGWTPGSFLLGYAWRTIDGDTVGVGRAFARLIVDIAPPVVAFIVFLTLLVLFAAVGPSELVLLVAFAGFPLSLAAPLLTLVTIRDERRQSLLDRVAGMRAYRIADRHPATPSYPPPSTPTPNTPNPPSSPPNPHP